MIIGIHQPNYIPWIGYFYKIMSCDKFVFLDDVQYIKNSYINRNKIKTPQGDSWLTLPVYFKGNFGENINKIKLKNELNWNEKHLKTIEMNYKKSPFFQKYFNDLKEIYSIKYEYISDLNISIIKYILKVLDIKTEILLSSELQIEGSSTERLINICKALGGDKYFSGKGGEKYQDEDLYSENKIDLIYTDFVHPHYPQLWNEFLPNMSMLDFLFNCGEECVHIIKENNNK